MPVPNITDEQRRLALDKAMHVRAERAKAKRAVKHGERTVADVLSDESLACSRMRVRQLLASVPGIGTRKAARLMEELGIPANRRVGGLGRKQREAVLEAIGGQDD